MHFQGLENQVPGTAIGFGPQCTDLGDIIS